MYDVIEELGLSREAADRFLAKCARSGACVLWTGETQKGWPNFCLAHSPRRRVVRADALAFWCKHARIPDPIVGHTCGHKACVNPDHIEMDRETALQRAKWWVHGRK